MHFIAFKNINYPTKSESITNIEPIKSLLLYNFFKNIQAKHIFINFVNLRAYNQVFC